MQDGDVKAAVDGLQAAAADWRDLWGCYCLPLDDFLRAENLFATHHDGAPLTPEHGGPVRFVVHHLYAWKSAKWIAGVEVLTAPQRGFWEQRGYHLRGENAWSYKGAKPRPYQQEHDDLFAAIRGGQPYNEARYGAESTLTAIMGRMATYTGKVVTWDQALASEVVTPGPYEWAELGVPKVAVPGQA